MAATPAYANPYLDPVTGLPKGGTATPWVGTQAQVDDSVANHVAALTSKDSKMNQMARTEGLKLANSRGMLNSSMGIGAAQDAVIRNALPIAAQDAGQAFQKNQQARGFEYGMEDKSRQNAFTSGERIGTQAWQTSEGEAGRAWQTGERIGTQEFQTAENIAQRGFLGDQAGLDRQLQQLLTDKQITSAEFQQLRSLNTQTDIAEAANALQLLLLEKQQGWATSERLGTQEYQASEAGLNRNLELSLQNNMITEAQRAQIAAIAATGDLAAAADQLQRDLQANQHAWETTERSGREAFERGENVAAREWQTAENLEQRGFLGTQADLDRDLQQLLQQNQLDEAEEAQIRDIASREGIEAANRALQVKLLDKDIAARMAEGNLDRASAERMQKLDIASDQLISKLNTDLQKTIASWNVKSTDKLAAAQYVTNVGAQYTADIDSINANTNLSATARTTALTAAKNRQSTKLNLGEQLFGIDLKWA